jgi:hypothetical protein
MEEETMGRTVPTFTMVLQQEMDSWSKFRRGLRREDQEALDDLFRAARLQLAGSAYAARPIPFESIVMSMIVMQHRLIRELQTAVAARTAPRETWSVPLLREVPPVSVDVMEEHDAEANDSRMAL